MTRGVALYSSDVMNGVKRLGLSSLTLCLLLATGSAKAGVELELQSGYRPVETPVLSTPIKLGFFGEKMGTKILPYQDSDYAPASGLVQDRVDATLILADRESGDVKIESFSSNNKQFVITIRLRNPLLVKKFSGAARAADGKFSLDIDISSFSFPDPYMGIIPRILVFDWKGNRRSNGFVVIDKYAVDLPSFLNALDADENPRTVANALRSGNFPGAISVDSFSAPEPSRYTPSPLNIGFYGRRADAQLPTVEKPQNIPATHSIQNRDTSEIRQTKWGNLSIKVGTGKNSFRVGIRLWSPTLASKVLAAARAAEGRLSFDIDINSFALSTMNTGYQWLGKKKSKGYVGIGDQYVEFKSFFDVLANTDHAAEVAQHLKAGTFQSLICKDTLNVGDTPGPLRRSGSTEIHD